MFFHLKVFHVDEESNFFIKAGSAENASALVQSSVQNHNGCIMLNLGYDTHKMCPSVLYIEVLNEEGGVLDRYHAFIGGADNQDAGSRRDAIYTHLGLIRMPYTPAYV